MSKRPNAAESAYCCVDECENDAARGRRGMCLMHYTRVRRYGDASISKIIVGDDEARIKSNSIVDDSGCWVWQRRKKLGYGYCGLNGRLEMAHRASWMVFVGPIPDGMQINHKCHNSHCVNPDHLYVGTQKQNMADMDRAGRRVTARGEDGGNTKLNTSQVVEIKKRIKLGEFNGAIAATYGVAPTTISSIRCGKTWSHV